jgi:uncharacterized short protein YbdD (DUF466 family)
MTWLALMAATARSMVGIPSYAAYREHMATYHPDATPMDEIAFFRDRQQARYGGKGGGRCC